MTNEKSNPTDVQFILADDIREETGGKLSLIGAYTGREITITPNKAVPEGKIVAIPLAFLFIIRGTKGLTKVQFAVQAPSKKIVGSVALEPKIGTETTTNLVVRAPQMPLPEDGIYTVELSLPELGTEPYRFTFKVIFAAPSL